MPATRTRATHIDSGDEDGPGRAGGQDDSIRRDFNDKVYTCVRRIPEGRVASYGQIAKLINHPRHSRLVGTALKVLPRNLSSPYILAPPAPSAAGSSSSSSSASTSRSGSNSSSRATSNHGDVGVLDALEENGAQRDGGENDGEEEDDDDVLPAPLPNPLVVPWWRVVSQTGVISPRGNDRAVDRQADYLRAEGVVVRDGPRNGGGGGGGGRAEEVQGVDAFGLGGSVAGGRVSMAKYAWKG
ncbi:hypothetical protein JCM8097_006876 [Rhodosporidiobolus ruineniae]